jgi:tRNA-specific 2-thiouridylase
VTLRLWLDPAGPDAARACCSPEAVVAARDTCHALGIPHVTLDVRDRFKEAIVEEFVRAYRRGETPNPCTRCNGRFRFSELLRFARRAGAARLATGHYARIVRHRGRLLVARGIDPEKDQSYMLARVDPRLLERLWFPLGDQTKEETRTEAAHASLAVAARSESQEACFLAGGDYRQFLERSGLRGEAGRVVDEQGAQLGRHDGFWKFTAGQRKGLGVASNAPMYALRTDARRNLVVVGPRESLAVRRVSAAGQLFVPVRRGAAKLRARSESVGASVHPTESGFRLHLDGPFYGAAKGQTAVLYEGDVVVGSGTITSVRAG